MKKKHIIVISLVFLLLAGAYGLRKYNQRDPFFDLNQSGKVAPEFSLPKISGGEMKMSDYKGKLVLLNFWASWCPPCRAEIPGFINIQKSYKDKNFTLIGVALEEKASAKRYATDIGINYPSSYGEETAYNVAAKYGNPDGGLPFSLLISPEQKIISVHPGFLSGEKLRVLLDKYLQ